MAEAIAALVGGRANNGGTVTLGTSVATTTVNSELVKAAARIILTPQHLNAAAALATTYIPVATVTAGQFIINHANNATANRTFTWAVVGG